jgi:hypothetical protein
MRFGSQDIIPATMERPSTTAAKRGPMPKPKAIEIGDKDVPLRDDTRLLGRILGDTVREQSGETVFGTVEHIRRRPG